MKKSKNLLLGYALDGAFLHHDSRKLKPPKCQTSDKFHYFLERYIRKKYRNLDAHRELALTLAPYLPGLQSEDKIPGIRTSI